MALSWLCFLPLAAGHAGFWAFREGCDVVPKATSHVMGNPVNVRNAEALQVTGARKGFYRPGKNMEIRFRTELYNAPRGLDARVRE